MGTSGRRARLDGREIDAVLVDAGGVLVDPNWQTIAEILGRHGIGADPDELAAADPFLRRELDDVELVRGSTDVVRRERFMARLLRHAGVEADAAAIDAASDELETIHRERGLWELITAGAAEALDTLRSAGLRLSLASNAEPSLRGKLAELGLAHRFDHLAISGEVGVEKPDARLFTGALDALGISPEHAIHIGDLYEVDVVGARSAGLEAILIDVADLSADRDVVRARSLADVPSLIGIG